MTGIDSRLSAVSGWLSVPNRPRQESCSTEPVTSYIPPGRTSKSYSSRAFACLRQASEGVCAWRLMVVATDQGLRVAALVDAPGSGSVSARSEETLPFA